VTVLDAPPGLPLLALTEPLPGFPVHRHYVLVPALGSGDGAGLLYWLQSVEPDGPRFLAVRARAYFPGYAPALPRAVRGELALDEGEEATLYCLVTVPAGDPQAATANLRAPLAVNPARGSARQVVLQDAAHPIREPLRR
jgi:flagellar assembly factor FliW